MVDKTICRICDKHMKKIALIAFLSFSVCSALQASGIMLYTTGGASYVNIAYYSEIKSPGAHIQNLTLKDGSIFQVRTDGVIADIPYPGATATKNLNNIPSLIAQTEMLSTRYPQYSSVLTSVGTAWKKIRRWRKKLGTMGWEIAPVAAFRKNRWTFVIE